MALSNLPKHYRYRTTCDEAGNVEIFLEEFEAIKETPQGYWVVPGYSVHWSEENQTRRWVSKWSRRRYCYATLSEAWSSYRIRCHKRVGHLRAALDVAEAAAKLVSPLKSPPPAGSKLVVCPDWSSSLFQD